MIKIKAFEVAAQKLLTAQAPIKLDARTAFPTVDELPGGPFSPVPLRLSPDAMAKPLPPGDYAVNCIAYCAQYGFHRPGKGVGYELAPLRGKASDAVANLLWRGTFAGADPKALVAVAWAIESGITYSQMPSPFGAIIDKYIPDYKGEIEDDFIQKVEELYQRFASKASLPPLELLLTKIGPPGRTALDAITVRTGVARYAGEKYPWVPLYEGQESGIYTPVKAEQAPWTVRIPGVAYMRFRIEGGHLATNNVIEIRILPAASRARFVRSTSHIALVSLGDQAHPSPPSPTFLSLMNAQATPNGINSAGLIGYPMGEKSQDLTPIPLPLPPPPPPTIVDPVTIATAQRPSRILSTPQDLVSSEARLIAGVAADGVARAVVRIPTAAAGQSITVSVCGDAPNDNACGKQDADEYGALTSGLEAGLSSVQQQIGLWQSTVQALSASVAGAPSPQAFVVYRSPSDFVRKENNTGIAGSDICLEGYNNADCQSSLRTVSLEINGPGIHQWLTVEVVRPAVMLIHGYTSSPDAWNSFAPVIGPTSAIPTVRLDYTPLAHIDLDSSGRPQMTPSYREVGSTISSNQLGLLWNEELLLPQLVSALDCVRQACSSTSVVMFYPTEGRLAVAAAQVDVVGHSMGGLLARAIWRWGKQQYCSPGNYGAGLFHKVITLGTPHLGSDYATQIMSPANQCLRTITANDTANRGTDADIPLQSVVIHRISFGGGSGDLIGGSLLNASQAIRELSTPPSNWPPLRIAYVAAEAQDANFTCLSNFGLGTVLRHSWCKTEPLILDYNASKWSGIFNGAGNDGFVSVSSALNGLPRGANGTKVIPGVVHGHGTVQLGFCGPCLQDSLATGNWVMALLNSSVSNSTVFRQLP